LSNLGKKRPAFSDEHKRKLSDAAQKRKHSEETKKKMSNVRKGVPKPPERQVICSTCKKEGSIRNMMRYHFDNCKFKILLNHKEVA
jgi:DNA-directed RNA polymerase subunit RPC12/RpoP